jgi:hypothetical protein
MKIKILTSCSSQHFAYTQGEVVSVKDDIAKDLIGARYAASVTLDPKKPPKEVAPNAKPNGVKGVSADRPTE